MRGVALAHRSSAAGVGGVAVIDVVGEHATAVLSRAFRSRRGGLPAPGRVGLGVIVDARGTAVDDVLVSRLEASASWCGLGGWSVSCHGGPAVTGRVLGVLEAAGARRVGTEELLEHAAARGAIDEIRRQAFPLFLDALTGRAARHLARELRGALAARLRGLLARIESASGDAAPPAAGVLEELDRMVEEAGAARRLFEPLRVLIAGRTNAGKSALFNALLGEERVVVSPRPGTTRDLIEGTIEIEGYPVTLIDSAGLRCEEARDPVEREGIRRALEAPRDAVLFLSERGEPLDAAEGRFVESVEGVEGVESAGGGRIVLVRTKADLAARRDARPGARKWVDISCVPGHDLRRAGLAALRERMRSAWLGPPEAADLPPLPFTADLVERTCALRRAWSRLEGSGEARRARARAMVEDAFPGVLAGRAIDGGVR